jgi:hypothetical protein
MKYRVETFDRLDGRWFTQFRGLNREEAKDILDRLNRLFPRFEHRMSYDLE